MVVGATMGVVIKNVIGIDQFIILRLYLLGLLSIQRLRKFKLMLARLLVNTLMILVILWQQEQQ